MHFDFMSDKLGYQTNTYVILPECMEKGVEIHYEEMSGGHDWNVWDVMIQKFLAWVTDCNGL